VFERCAGSGDAVSSPIGYLPAPGAIPTEGLDVSDEDMAELLRVDVEEWKAESEHIAGYYEEFGDRVPPQLLAQLEALRRRLG
jgi:phosphoenolpyruvate carboxykinase (GTP)